MTIYGLYSMPIDLKAKMKMKWKYESRREKAQKTGDGITTPCEE